MELDAQQLRALVKAAAAVAEAVDLHQVLKTAVEMAQQSTGAKYAALGVRNEHGTLGEFIHVGMTPDLAEKVGRLPIGRGLLGRLLTHPEPLRVDDLPAHENFAGFPPDHPPMGNFLGVPIAAGSTIFGNFYLTDKPGGFTEADEMMVEALAAVVGSAVSAAQLNLRIRRMALVEDRERIARDLHDAVIQELFAVGLGLQSLAVSLGEGPTSERLEQAIVGIDDAIDALRGFIFDLRSVGVTVIDPERAVRRLVARLVANRPVETEVVVAGVDPAQADVFDDALQVVRESVSNAVRHAGAQRLTVSVLGSVEGITVEVTDDGRGFDPQTVRRGLGLDNLTARVRVRGGNIEISARNGTSVSAFLPA
jgi:signal transduction histidine kinase